jgi:hypothetical protein
MRKTKLVITMCVTAVVLSGTASSVASAATAGWMVNGTLLTGTKSISTATVDESWRFSSQGVSVECSGSTVNAVDPEFIAPNKRAAKSVEFTGCSANAQCVITKTLHVVPIVTEATLEGALAVTEIIKPATKTTLATVWFEGALCAFEGTQTMTGKAKVSMPTGHDERTLQLNNMNVTEASGELKAGSSNMSAQGSTLIRLASGEPWRFL